MSRRARPEEWDEAANPAAEDDDSEDGLDFEYLNTLTELEREQIIYEHTEKIESRKARAAAAEDLARRKQAELRQNEAKQTHPYASQPQDNIGTSTTATSSTTLTAPIQSQQTASAIPMGRIGGATPPSSDDDDDDEDFDNSGAQGIRDDSDDESRLPKDDNYTPMGTTPQQPPPPDGPSQPQPPPPPVATAPNHEPKKPGMHNWNERKELNLRDMKDVQLTRRQLQKLVKEPYFEHFVVGLYVKILIGENPASGDKVYRVCEIEACQEGRSYVLLDHHKSQTNKWIIVRHGTQRKHFRIIMASDSPFTEGEFEKWKRTMRAQDLGLPKPTVLRDRLLRAKLIPRQFIYNSETLNDIRHHKSTLSNIDVRALPNLNKARTRYEQQLRTLETRREKEERSSRGVNGETGRSIEAVGELLDRIHAELMRRRQKQTVGISHEINEQNRKRNNDKIVKARKRALQKEDPFARARTLPKIESFNMVKSAADAKAAKAKQNKDGSQSPKKKRRKFNDVKLNISAVKASQKSQSMASNLTQNAPLSDLSFADDSNLLIKDGMWTVVHQIAKQFQNVLDDVALPVSRPIAPIFGRNTAPSTYASEFEQTPDDGEILTAGQYLDLKSRGEM